MTEPTKAEVGAQLEIKTEIPEGNIPTVYNPDFGTLAFLGDDFLLEQGDPTLLLPPQSEQGKLSTVNQLLYCKYLNIIT